MFKIFKKCEKNDDNIYGVKYIESLDELVHPFMLCLSPQDDNNSTFGIVKQGANAARVRTSNELAGGFKIDEMPFDFLGIKSSLDGNFSSLVDDFIYPILTRYNKNLDTVIKNARNINFFTYCDATRVYVEIEKRLIEKLTLDGFSEEDIKKIISQISLISISTKVKLTSVLATTILFKDANDIEVYDYISKTALKKMNINGRQVFIDYLKTGGNGAAYVYNGTGEHSLKEYFKEVNICKSSMCAAVAKIVENSILNSKSVNLIPLSIKSLVPIVVRNNGEFKDCSELLYDLDNSLQYGVTRYSESEHNELCSYEEYLKSNGYGEGISRH